MKDTFRVCPRTKWKLGLIKYQNLRRSVLCLYVTHLCVLCFSVEGVTIIILALILFWCCREEVFLVVVVMMQFDLVEKNTLEANYCLTQTSFPALFGLLQYCTCITIS